MQQDRFPRSCTMKILITLSKNNERSNPKLTVSCDDASVEHELRGTEESVMLTVPHKSRGSYLLRITRDEPLIGITHATWVKVESIQIDELWEIGKFNHWSKTEYSPDYVAHVQSQAHSWELTAGLYNDILFFNGSLSYEISAPARKMFWS